MSGPGCSQLTTYLVNEMLIYVKVRTTILCQTKRVVCALQKLLTFFQPKIKENEEYKDNKTSNFFPQTCFMGNGSLNKSLTNDFVKLPML